MMKVKRIEMKFEIGRDEQGFAHSILEDGRVIIHLNCGTIRNEENIERVVYLLNVAYGSLYDLDTKSANLESPISRPKKEAWCVFNGKGMKNE